MLDITFSHVEKKKEETYIWVLKKYSIMFRLGSVQMFETVRTLLQML